MGGCWAIAGVPGDEIVPEVSFLYKILATVMRWGLPCQSVIRVLRLVELCGVDTTGEMEQFVFGAGIGPPWEPGGVLCIIGVPPGGYIIPV